MARLLTGPEGPFRGKLGNAVGTFWKGISVMRVLPVNRKDANTPLQQVQREKVKLISSYLSNFKPLINIGFAAVNLKKSAFNNALKYNLNAIEGEFPNFSINMQKFKLSIGKLQNVWDPTIEVVEGNAIKITWTNNTDNDSAFASDRLFICAVQDETRAVKICEENVTRDALTAIIILPKEWSGSRVYIIGFFAKAGIRQPKFKNEVSTSFMIHHPE